MNERCPTCGVPLRLPRSSIGAVDPGGAPSPRVGCARCGGSIERADLIAPPRARGALGEFLVGIRLALRGARLVISRPGLLSLAVLPLVLNVLLFLVLCVVLVTWRETFVPSFDTPWWPWIDWLRRIVAGATEGLLILFGLALAFVATWVLYPVIAAPFLELLSEATENLVFGHKDERRKGLGYAWRFWVLPVLQAASLAIFTGALGFAFLLLSFSAVLAPFAFAGTTWLLAVSLCDTVIARKSFPATERFRFVRDSLATWLGLALPFLFVPFLLPFGVAGATLTELRQRQVAPRDSAADLRTRT